MSAQTPKLGVFNGLICIRKPIHVSSGDVVAAVKSKVTKFIIESLPPSQRPKSRKQEHKLVKVGHGGTLDPLATGCLVVGVGSGTKHLGKFLQCTKEYIATGILGSSTDTYDSTGQTVQSGAHDAITKEQIEEALAKYRGDIMQKPPVFSALRVNGKRMYDLARAGEADNIEVKARPVTIHELELLECTLPTFKLKMKVSSGTYVRSVIHDVGVGLGCFAHMTDLSRTAQGPFLLDGAVSIPLKLRPDLIKAAAESNANADNSKVLQSAEKEDNVDDMEEFWKVADNIEKKLDEGMKLVLENMQDKPVSNEKPAVKLEEKTKAPAAQIAVNSEELMISLDDEDEVVETEKKRKAEDDVSPVEAKAARVEE